MLDQTVAGGLTAGLTPFETLVKECGEEASLEPAFVEKYARAAGLISYVRRNDAGFIQPEVQYCYDLKFPLDGPRPRPNDDEVESFTLMTEREALDAVLAGQFKPNCALVLLHFLIRHGRITAESDTRFLELNQRLHRSHCLPGPA
jgi:8-oxo-dGTP pyrophosphatase MutT (NUDIX family)